MKAASAVRDWFFMPMSPRRIAGIRIALCTTLAVRLARPLYLELAGQPPALFRPLSFMKLFDQMPGRGAVITFQIVGVVAAALAAAGVFTRASLPVAWTSAVFLNGMHTSVGKVMHNDVLLLLALVPLLVAPVSDAWSLGSKGVAVPGDSSPKYGWPIRASALAVAGAYFFAGYWKLRFSGLSWVTSDNMRWILYASSDSQPVPNSVALFFAARPPLAQLIAGVTLFFELTFPIALFSRLAAAGYALGAAGLHLGIMISMRLDYTAWIVTVLAVVPDWAAFRAAVVRFVQKPRGPVAKLARG